MIFLNMSLVFTVIHHILIVCTQFEWLSLMHYLYAGTGKCAWRVGWFT